MFISKKFKLRIITTGDPDWKTPVIEIFRWSEEANGWVHIADATDRDQLDAWITEAEHAELEQIEERVTPI
jgi:hypothetical protein